MNEEEIGSVQMSIKGKRGEGGAPNVWKKSFFGSLDTHSFLVCLQGLSVSKKGICF